MTLEKKVPIDLSEACDPQENDGQLRPMAYDQDAIRKLVFGVQDPSHLNDSDPALGGFWTYTEEELRSIQQRQE